MAARQLPAASRDSCALSWTCINFSASRKVAAETSGPTGGEVAKAEGAPGGALAGTPLCARAASCAPRVAPTTPKEALARKRLREFFKESPGFHALAFECFFYLSQALLAEKHFIADEESRDAEGATRGGRVRVGGEFCLDDGILGGIEDGLGVKARGTEHFGNHGGIIHLLPIFPHGFEDCFEVQVEYVCAACCQQPTHDQERVDREVRVEAEGPEAVLGDEALRFEPFVLEFAFHIA